MSKLYMFKFDEMEVVFESTSEENAPTVQEFRDDYNQAYDIVSSDADLVSDKEEYIEIVSLLVKTGKYRQPNYEAILLMEGSLESADVVNENIITAVDEETPGFTMEELNKLSNEF